MTDTDRVRTLLTLSLVALAVLAGCNTLSGSAGQETTAAELSPTATATEAGGTDAPTATVVSTVEPTQTATATPTETATATPPDTDTATPAGTPENDSLKDVEYTQGSLPVDEDKIYAQIEDLHGVERPPPTVTVYESQSLSLTPYPDTFYGVFGIPASITGGNDSSGMARPNGRLTIWRDENATADSLASVLAHEYVHHIHFKIIQRNGGYPYADTTDESMVIGAVIEGAAVWTTDQWHAKYRPDAQTNMEDMRQDYGLAGPAAKLFVARYIEGAEYVNHTVDDPKNISAVYQSYPDSMEQVMHPETKGDDPPKSLRVTTAEWSEWEAAATSTERRGELVVREILRTELNRSEADGAAAGWGMDRQLTFENANNESQVGVTWALRYDSKAEADDLEAAFERYEQRREIETSIEYRVVRVSDQTVVVLAGHPSFVANASVSGSDDSVTVGPSEQ